MNPSTIEDAAPGARHSIENSLAAYCAAVDARDAERLGELLKSVDLVFRNEVVRGSVADFYERAFTTAGYPTQHLFANLAVTMDGSILPAAPHGAGSVARPLLYASYCATYQRWEHRPDGPACVALGAYSGHFATSTNESHADEPSCWVWTAHQVSTKHHPATAQQPKENDR